MIFQHGSEPVLIHVDINKLFEAILQKKLKWHFILDFNYKILRDQKIDK